MVGILTAAIAYGPPAAQADTLEGLAARIDDAVRHVDAARDAGAPLGDPGSFFPAGEEVTWGQEAMAIDHASLRAEWRAIPAEGPPRRQALDRLRHRLVAVRAELRLAGAAGGESGRTTLGAQGAAGTPGADAAAQPPQGWRGKLAEILSGSEFKKRQAQETLLSLLKKWLGDKLSALLPRGARRAVGRFVNWIIYGLAGGAVILVLVVLLRAALPLFTRDRRAGQPRGPSAPAQPETPEGLLAVAEARTRAGDYRGAVQATFRWMVLRLHLAGRLDYDPALTNREHLARLKADPPARAAFAELCERFELAWYALRPVGPEEYAVFRAGCRGLAGAQG